MMIFAKYLFTAGLMVISATQAMAQSTLAATGTYRLYLYFGDTKPFTDELILKVGSIVEGTMRIPNDFDAAIERPVLTSDGKLVFHVTLPHKYDAAFPKGLDYTLQFESPHASGTALSYDRVIGFVEQRANKAYVGSIVGFRE